MSSKDLLKVLLSILILNLVVECSDIRKKYYSDGQLKMKARYKNNKLNGKSIFYHKNGKVKEIAYYEDGVPVDSVKTFYSNGNLKRIAFFKNGEVNGILKSFYRNGQLKLKAKYKNGKVNGTVKEFFKNGQIKRKAFRVDSTVYFEQRFNYDGEFDSAFRELSVTKEHDTISLGDTFEFKVRAYGTSDSVHYFEAGFLKKNIKDIEEVNPKSKAKLSKGIIYKKNDTSISYKMSFSLPDTFLKSIKVDPIDINEKKNFKSKIFIFKFVPKNRGSHKLAGFYKVKYSNMAIDWNKKHPLIMVGFQYHFVVEFYVN